jgi:hypothetical protein
MQYTSLSTTTICFSNHLCRIPSSLLSALRVARAVKPAGLYIFFFFFHLCFSLVMVEQFNRFELKRFSVAPKRKKKGQAAVLH